MAQQKKNDSNNSAQAKVGLGIGLAAAAIAGAYYLYGSKEGAKRRAKIKGWTLRAKGEVLEKLETLKEVNEESYNKIVDAVTEKYKKVKGVDLAEVVLLAQDMKKHWTSIRRQMEGPKKGGKKTAARRPASRKQASKSAKTQASHSTAAQSKK